MEKKRFIFDLDGTLLTCNYKVVEEDLFRNIFKEKADDLVPNIGKLLDEYENTHRRYLEEDLCRFLSMKTGLDFNQTVIDEWTSVMEVIPDVMEDGIIEVLEHLKSKDKSLVVLTNWYGKSQIARLKKAGIHDYFDAIYSGEYQLKPHEEAYLTAIAGYTPEECVLIGDNLYKDYIAPRAYGIESILYDKDSREHEAIAKVKKMNELIKRY